MPDDPTAADSAVIAHVKSLLFDAKVPALGPDLAGHAGMEAIHAYLIELRQLLDDYANGDFSREIHLRGVVAGRIKAFQANILHLVWQVQQVAKGDFSQRVEYMGELSSSFNSMVVQLDEALGALKRKEEELTELTGRLEDEVELRGEALRELSVSEARFKYLAEHDPLTGVLNRRSFSALADMELCQAAARAESCCVVLLDIDHFKRFNDTHGHLEGDEAIKHVIKICQDCLRHNDLIGRYGGEEFVMLFSGANERQGMGVAERIRSEIDRSRVRLRNKEEVALTASIGLVEIAAGRYLANEKRFLPFVLAAADLALYQAKKDGRNLARAAPLGEFRRDSVRLAPSPRSSRRYTRE